MLDADGEQAPIDAEAEYIELAVAVGNVPGFYRLDQRRDGMPIEDVPPAYVSIESTRNAAPTAMPIRATRSSAISPDYVNIARTITERFGNVMEATADVLRAADGAGCRRHTAATAPARRLGGRDDEDEDDEDDEDDDDEEDVEPGPLGKILDVINEMLPMVQEWMDALGVRTARAGGPRAPPPAAAAPHGAGGGHADPREHSTGSRPRTRPRCREHDSAPVLRSDESTTTYSASPSAAGIADAIPTAPAQPDAPRNRPGVLDPTHEQWGHLFAVRARLSP